jgi:hypothetical protein
MTGQRRSHLGTAAILAGLRSRPDLAEALAVFDGLPAVAVDDMIGTWRGSEIPTGHPLDGSLSRLGWYGKRFVSAENVHPLVFTGLDGGLWNLDPARVPMGLLARRPSLAHLPGTGRLLHLIRPLLATRRPTARLRSTEYRGVVTATMCYDALPIHDAFRRLDEDTVLGVMDQRGAAPYVFLLERDRSFGPDGSSGPDGGARAAS